MKIQLRHKFEDLVSLDNLLSAWREFLSGKRSKTDVQQFSVNLIENVLQLHEELVSGKYKHGPYHDFWVFDPKPRHIHKADVRDRVLHHAIYRVLYPFFDRIFVADSFSCRNNKGTHKALDRFKRRASSVSKNNTKTCWILKCDVKKFFDSIDHRALLSILHSYITDARINKLLENIIDSFYRVSGRGLPLGNLTSQLFCNIYMNEMDQFIKHQLKVKHYIRYADDFALFSENREWLVEQVVKIREFLKDRLALSLHPKKVFIKTLASGVDFLGWVHFPDHRVLRTTTKKRMFKRMQADPSEETRQSYLGMLKHGNTHKIRKRLFGLTN